MYFHFPCLCSELSASSIPFHNLNTQIPCSYGDACMEQNTLFFFLMKRRDFFFSLTKEIEADRMLLSLNLADLKVAK